MPHFSDSAAGGHSDVYHQQKEYIHMYKFINDTFDNQVIFDSFVIWGCYPYWSYHGAMLLSVRSFACSPCLHWFSLYKNMPVDELAMLKLGLLAKCEQVCKCVYGAMQWTAIHSRVFSPVY